MPTFRAGAKCCALMEANGGRPYLSVQLESSGLSTPSVVWKVALLMALRRERERGRRVSDGSLALPRTVNRSSIHHTGERVHRPPAAAFGYAARTFAPGKG